MTREEARIQAEKLLEQNFGDTQRMPIPPDMWVDKVTDEILKMAIKETKKDK